MTPTDPDPSPPDPNRARPAMVAALVSVALVAVKAVAWWFTGSTALLASLLDSSGDTLVSAGNFVVLRAAGQPADREHPFGHGKLEHLAGLFQAVLIGASGLFLVVESFQRLDDGAHVQLPLVGTAAAVVSLVAAWGLARWLRSESRRLDSPALEADSRHYATDYLVNGGVLAAMAADGLFDYAAADPVISVLIAALILRSAWELLMTSGHALMDHELTRDDIARVHEAVMGFGPPVRGYHDLLTRRSGPDRFVQIHVALDAELSFRQAHDLTERIARSIEEHLEGARVTIHADPWPERPEHEAPRKPHGHSSDDHEELLDRDAGS